MVVTVGVWIYTRDRRRDFFWFVLGVVPPAVLHVVLQSKVTGTLLPVEMYPEAFNFPGSYWATEVGKWSEPGPRWKFGLELLFGPQGWITVTPVLVFGLVGIFWTSLRRNDPLHVPALTVAAALVAVVAFYIWGVRRTDVAGQSYGSRHLLPITPLCFFFACVLLARLRIYLAQKRSFLVRGVSCAVRCLFVLLAIVSCSYAYMGMLDPWSRIERRSSTNATLAVLQKFVLYSESSYSR